MDLRLIPMLAVLYLLSFLDRGNIGNAKIQGMQTDLNLSGPEYNLCATVFVSGHIDSDLLRSFAYSPLVLHLLCIRDSFKLAPEAPQTLHLVAIDNGCMG